MLLMVNYPLIIIMLNYQLNYYMHNRIWSIFVWNIKMNIEFLS
jgi:hypothetical protein